ncbi:S1C family serine protease [Clostridium paraputrificum]|uniref:S1C family serine protease n=1 Tax=Clostridium TaxID=1485 RepID=UPI003D33F2EA
MNTENNNEDNKSFVFYGEENNSNQENDARVIFTEGPVKKKRKNGIKILGVIAGGLAVAMTGGLIGGLVTYNVMNKNGTVVESKSYAAPEFTSASDGTLTVSEAFEKVKPAVVTISTKGIQKYNGLYPQEVSGIGSGFIINEEGYVLTNYHVIEGSQEVTALLSDGSEVKAKVVNYDQAKDMAMLKLADGTKVPGVAELGDSDALYPGQDVIAVGTPLSKDFAQTITKGVISAVNRNIEASTGVTMNVIQTDTAINPGNSGGPLVNTKGQVIGINSMKLVVDNVEGMGFSIPINDAKDRIDTLSKPIITLGVSVREIDEATAKRNDYPEGLFVKDVVEFSPAEKAGIKIADIITKFDGKRIKTFDELNEIKGKKNIGDKVEVAVERNGKEVTLTLELTES